MRIPLIAILLCASTTTNALSPLTSRLLSKKSDEAKSAQLELPELDANTRKTIAAELEGALLQKDETTRQLACYGLIALGQEGLGAIKKNLKSKSRDVRFQLVTAIGRPLPWNKTAPNPALKPALISALSDEDSNIRMNAVLALGKLGTSTIPAISKALQDKDKYVRRRAAEALQQFGPAAKLARGALSKTLTDEDDGVRDAAKMALEAINNQK